VDRRQLIALRQSAEATRRPSSVCVGGAARTKHGVGGGVGIRRYFLVWTTLSAAFPAAAILDLYRLRWQIELVFKRMKSILGLGHLPRRTLSAPKLGWKANCSRTLDRTDGAQRRNISPWGYALAGPTQQVARG